MDGGGRAMQEQLPRAVISLLKETGLRYAGLQMNLALNNPFSAGSMSREEHERAENKQGIGKRAESEATREGETVVLADHSTDGRIILEGREGGEPRPKGSIEGKEKPGTTFCREER